MNQKVKNSGYFVGLAILCSLLIFSISNIINILKERDFQQKDVIYNYQKDGNIDYKVYLKKNDFIKSDYLNKDEYYVSQLINYIATDFNYKFNGDKNAKLEYSYYIRGILTGIYSDSISRSSKAKIWTKEYDLKNNVSKKIEGKELLINEKLNINLDSYNLDVEKFVQTLGIPISAKLTIQFNVKINGTVDNKNFVENDIIYMDIPLSLNVFAIDGPFNVSSDKQILRTDAVVDIINNEMIINGILLIISLLSIALILKKFMLDGNKSPYQIERERILNEYSNRIVIIKNFLNIPEENYINVVTFDELIDLVDELNIPILCWIRHSIHETWFVVINEKITYRYILKANK